MSLAVSSDQDISPFLAIHVCLGTPTSGSHIFPRNPNFYFSMTAHVQWETLELSKLWRWFMSWCAASIGQLGQGVEEHLVANSIAQVWQTETLKPSAKPFKII